MCCITEINDNIMKNIICCFFITNERWDGEKGGRRRLKGPYRGADGYRSSVNLFFSSKFSWFFDIVDIHAKNVTTPLSKMSLRKILVVTPPPACNPHYAGGLISF